MVILNPVCYHFSWKSCCLNLHSLHIHGFESYIHLCMVILNSVCYNFSWKSCFLNLHSWLRILHPSVYGHIKSCMLPFFMKILLLKFTFTTHSWLCILHPSVYGNIKSFMLPFFMKILLPKFTFMASNYASIWIWSY